MRNREHASSMKSAFISFIIFNLFAALSSAADKTAVPSQVLRHIVMVQFKEETTSEQISKIEKQFAELEKEIETIIDYEWGLAETDGKESARNQGYTHCFVVTFADKAGLEVYVPHKAHLAFVEVFKPKIEKLLVLDFVTK